MLCFIILTYTICTTSLIHLRVTKGGILDAEYGIMILFLLSVLVVAYEEELIFKDEFNEFDLSKWSHEITLGGNGNSEFQMYVNSRNNSFARNGTLFIKPSLTKDCKQGKLFYEENKAFDIWGNFISRWGKIVMPH